MSYLEAAGAVLAGLGVCAAIVWGPRLAYRFIYHVRRSRWAREIGGR